MLGEHGDLKCYISAHLQFEAGLAVELAHGRGTLQVSPLAAIHILSLNKREELAVVDVPILADLRRGRDDVVVGDGSYETHWIARMRDAPTHVPKWPGTGSAYGVRCANAPEKQRAGRGPVLLAVR